MQVQHACVCGWAVKGWVMHTGEGGEDGFTPRGPRFRCDVHSHAQAPCHRLVANTPRTLCCVERHVEEAAPRQLLGYGPLGVGQAG